MSEEKKFPTKKQTRGRQKIAITKIVDRAQRQVTFSKRREGIYKKAAELSVICGAQVVVVFFSGKGKAFTCGYPSVGAVLRRFEERTAEAGPSPPPPPQYLEAVGREIEALEEEKEKLVEGIEEEEENKGGEWEGINVFWWNRDVDEMGSKELEEYMAALEALRAKAVMKARGY
ncbi:unnamed protein product [Cuscuta campestris]|uniref:MADS-box domain-containing protein n=1 Tax=Cuscuta campestris TaxID=132261 RepID=A0A484KRZ1_9ASTE|nr:unnamed protein product [Cuscuta campestris]